MTIITRFAPSPTGHLHVGNIRAALHNWMWAKKNGGKFLLRLDDTDPVRSKQEYADGIRADLSWLGLNWDDEKKQSDRFDLYEKSFEALKADGRVYPCYEEAHELDLMRKVLLGRGKPPVYDRAALKLTADEIAAYKAEGRTPHWRFKLDHSKKIEWNDLVRGPQMFDPSLLSDPVIRRGDGSWLYMLPSAIDDVDMGVSHVVRGEDHVSNTATQVQMFEALGADVPNFGHEALLTGTEGKLSKRLGSLGVSHFREVHLEAISVVALLARIGTSDPVEPVTDIAPLLESFDFTRFGRAPARFDEAELTALNQKIVHMLDYNAVADRLPDGMDENAWNVIRPNVENIAQTADWWALVSGPIAAQETDADDAEFIKQAATVLGDLPWGDTIWKDLTGALKEATGRKGKSLFMPLRKALTGMEHGPDMNALVLLIGRDEVLSRLNG